MPTVTHQIGTPHPAQQAAQQLDTMLTAAIAELKPAVEQKQEILAMSQKGSGLARLMGNMRALDAQADGLATRLETAMTNLTTEMATTEQIVGNVESSVTDLRAVNALYSNGPTSGSQEPSKGS